MVDSDSVLIAYRDLIDGGINDGSFDVSCLAIYLATKGFPESLSIPSLLLASSVSFSIPLISNARSISHFSGKQDTLSFISISLGFPVASPAICNNSLDLLAYWHHYYFCHNQKEDNMVFPIR